MSRINSHFFENEDANGNLRQCDRQSNLWIGEYSITTILPVVSQKRRDNSRYGGFPMKKTENRCITYFCGSGGTGRRAILRGWCPFGRAGSSPAFRTRLYFQYSNGLQILQSPAFLLLPLAVSNV